MSTPRAVLLSLLVGMFACAAGGLGGYTVANRDTPDFGPLPCKGSAHLCIPELEAASVIRTLKKQGHECNRTLDRWSCVLQIGVTEYALSLQVIGGQVHRYSARVSTSVDGPPGKTSIAYLSWLAQLPYAYDPAFAQRIRTWVGRQIEKGGTTHAAVGGYGYRVDADDEQVIDFEVRTVVPR